MSERKCYECGGGNFGWHDFCRTCLRRAVLEQVSAWMAEADKFGIPRHVIEQYRRDFNLDG